VKFIENPIRTGAFLQPGRVKKNVKSKRKDTLLQTLFMNKLPPYTTGITCLNYLFFKSNGLDWCRKQNIEILYFKM